MTEVVSYSNLIEDGEGCWEGLQYNGVQLFGRVSGLV